MPIIFILRPGPSTLSPSSQVDAVWQFFSLFMPFLPTSSSIASLTIYITSDYISERSVHIRHTLGRRAEIWNFSYFMKAFYQYIGMTDKFFALFLVGVFELVFSLSFLKWREMDPNLEATDLGWVFWPC